VAQRQLHRLPLLLSELDVQYSQLLRQIRLPQVIVGQDIGQGFRRSVLTLPDVLLVEPGPFQVQEAFL
jgi:hypothetical protein